MGIVMFLISFSTQQLHVNTESEAVLQEQMNHSLP